MKKNLFILIVLLCLLAPNFLVTIKASDMKLQLNYPTIPFLNKSLNDVVSLGGSEQLGVLIQYVYYFIIFISGITALVMIISGGIQYMTSAGSPAKITDAKDKIIKSILGIIIIFSSYLILTAVDPGFANLTIRDPISIIENNDNNGSSPLTGIGSFKINNQTESATVSSGDTITISWNATNLNQCQANSLDYKTQESNLNWDGELSSLSGSKSFSLNNTTLFRIVCYGNFTYTKDIIITVSDCGSNCQVPNIIFKISTDGKNIESHYIDGPVHSNDIIYGATVYWKATNADNCLSNDAVYWSTNSKTEGYFTNPAISSLCPSPLVESFIFTITCSNNEGSASKSVTLLCDY
jgi:hypothetical protein